MRLEIKDLSFRFGRRLILKDINCIAPAGTVVSLVGPNGSGKTTLLRCIVGSLDPQAGSVLVDGRTVRPGDRRQLARRIGYVPQMETRGLPATVFDMVLLGRRPYINWRPSERDLDVVAETLLRLDLKQFALREMNELSGGEKQKVLFARAVAQEPELLVLDEPTSNLDLKHQLELLEFIRLLAQRNGITVIMAMHDLNLAAMYSDWLVMIKDGRIQGNAPPQEIMTAENIKSLYGINVSISEESGVPHVILNRLE